MVGKDESEDPVPPKSPPTSVETTLYDLTDRCYDAFERLVEADTVSELHEDEVSTTAPRDLPGLKNSFAFWVDYTGSLAPVGASLDDRLAEYVEIKEMIIELLEMVERNISQLQRICAEVSPKRSEWDHSMLSIGAALDRLHFLASAIRKASAKKVFGEDILLSFATDEEIVFKNTAIAYVKWQFPKARKSLREYLGSTIAARRKIMLKRHSHEKKLAMRRAEKKVVFPVVKPLDKSMDSQRSTQLRGIPSVTTEQDKSPKRPGAATEATQASKLDANLVIKYIRQNKPSLSIRSSGTSRRGDSISQRYPSLPKIAPGERHVLCPYCRKPLRAGELRGSQATEFWEHHVDSDLQPYVCLFAQCLGQFFTHRSDWSHHMKTTHGTNWPRKVHCATWFCDIGHSNIAEFDNETDWKAHMRDSESHPNRKKGPTDLQLKALAVKKQQFALRDEAVCPLCEEIPERISILGSKGNHDDLFKILENHIAGHIKDLSFMSLPSLGNEQEDEADNRSATSQGSQKRLLNPGSIPRAPSLFEFMEDVSLTFTDNQGPLEEPMVKNLPSVNLNSPDQFKSELQRLSDLPESTQRDDIRRWIQEGINTVILKSQSERSTDQINDEGRVIRFKDEGYPFIEVSDILARSPSFVRSRPSEHSESDNQRKREDRDGSDTESASLRVHRSSHFSSTARSPEPLIPPYRTFHPDYRREYWKNVSREGGQSGLIETRNSELNPYYHEEDPVPLERGGSRWLADSESPADSRWRDNGGRRGLARK